MLCYMCERPTKIVETRQCQDGTVVRRHHCLNEACKTRFTTREVRIPDRPKREAVPKIFRDLKAERAERDISIRTMRAAGMSVAEICRKTGLGYSTIYHIVSTRDSQRTRSKSAASFGA